MSLRVRFSLFFLGFAVALLFVYSGSYYLLERRSERTRQNDQIQSALAKLAASCRDAGLESDWLAALQPARLAAAEPGVAGAECVDAEGRIRAHSTVQAVGTIEREPSGGVAAAFDLPAGKKGAARLFLDEAALARQIEDRLWRTLWRLALVSSLTLVAGVAAAWLLAESLVRPIRELVHGTEELRSGRLDVKVGGEERSDELGSLSRAFNGMAADLSKLEALKQEFIDSVTHDLKSPLSILTGLVDLLAAEPDRLSELQLRWLKSASEAADRLIGYINQILDYSRLRSGGFPMERRPTSLAGLAQSIANAYEGLALSKGLTLEVHLAPDLPEVDVDPDLIHRVATNLVSNALRYTPKGGRVTVSAARRGSFVRVEVADTGVGIPTDKQPKVFEKFFQVAEKGASRPGGGHGLGLAIAKQIVEAHGGAIGLRSALGEGSAFYFDLPTVNREPAGAGG